MKFYRYIILIFSFIICYGCIKDVDFDQIDDASIQSTYVLSLVYFNLTPPDFLDELNQEITLTTDAVETPISDDSDPYLEKIEFTVITENSINRAFTISFVFYNQLYEPIYTLQPEIYVPENSTEVTTILEIPEEDIDVIYSTAFIEGNLVLHTSSDGSVLNPDDPGTFNLKSSVKLFFNFRKV